jgi:hypothetical protein
VSFLGLGNSPKRKNNVQYSGRESSGYSMGVLVGRALDVFVGNLLSSNHEVLLP